MRAPSTCPRPRAWSTRCTAPRSWRHRSTSSESDWARRTVIPLHDANKTRSVPLVTRLLLGINIVLWLYVVSLSRNEAAAAAFYDRYSFDWNTFTQAISSGRATIDTFVPLLTHMFLHGGWLHIIGNMLYLWIFGDNVEDAMGSFPFLIFYLLCGVIAAIGQGLLSPGP